MSGSSSSVHVVDCLVEAYSAVLEVDDVDADSDFFELGGHSVLAGRVVARVREQLDLPISLRDVFTGRTPRAVATALHGREPLTR